MQNKPISIFKLLTRRLVIFIFLFGTLFFPTASGRADQECAIVIDQIWEEGKQLLHQLKNDPLAEGLVTYANDLERLEGELQEWLKRGNQNQALYEGLTIREHKAVERAKNILSPENAEYAFWLLAERKRKDVSAKNLTDCEAMAQLFGALGRKVSWDIDNMVEILGRVLSSGVSYTIPYTGGAKITLIAPGILKHVIFGQSGFPSLYLDTDPDSQNQVRHFVGYFVLGVKLPFDIVSKIVAEIRDRNQLADYELGMVAANLGKKIADQPSLIQGIEGAICTTFCVEPPLPPSGFRILP